MNGSSTPGAPSAPRARQGLKKQLCYLLLPDQAEWLIDERERRAFVDEWYRKIHSFTWGINKASQPLVTLVSKGQAWILFPAYFLLARWLGWGFIDATDRWEMDSTVGFWVTVISLGAAAVFVLVTSVFFPFVEYGIEKVFIFGRVFFCSLFADLRWSMVTLGSSMVAVLWVMAAPGSFLELLARAATAFKTITIITLLTKAVTITLLKRDRKHNQGNLSYWTRHWRAVIWVRRWPQLWDKLTTKESASSRSIFGGGGGGRERRASFAGRNVGDHPPISLLPLDLSLPRTALFRIGHAEGKGWGEWRSTAAKAGLLDDLASNAAEDINLELRVARQDTYGILVVIWGKPKATETTDYVRPEVTGMPVPSVDDVLASLGMSEYELYAKSGGSQ